MVSPWSFKPMSTARVRLTASRSGGIYEESSDLTHTAIGPGSDSRGTAFTRTDAGCTFRQDRS
jgi:hypothetical protein